MAFRAVAKAPGTPRLASWASAVQWSRLTETENRPAAFRSRASSGVSVLPVVKSLTAQPSAAWGVRRKTLAAGQRTVALALGLSLGAARGREPGDAMAAKYGAPLDRLFELRERFAPLHPALEKVFSGGHRRE